MTYPRANLSLWKPSIPCPSVSFYLGMGGYFLPLQSDVVKLGSQNCFSVALWGFLSNTVGYFSWEKSPRTYCSSIFSMGLSLPPPSGVFPTWLGRMVRNPQGTTGPGGLALCGLLKLWESPLPFSAGEGMDFCLLCSLMCSRGLEQYLNHSWHW